MAIKRSKPNAQKASEAASLLGKRSWKVRLKRFGLKRLQEMAAKMGRKSKGRPRLPDDQVSKAALYQRARRERLRQQAKQKGTERTVSDGKERSKKGARNL